jgi:hypothetical protein
MEPPEPDVPLWMAIAGILGLIAIAAGGLLLLLMRRVGFRTLETAFAVLGAWMVLPPLIGAYYGLIQILEGSEFTR